MSATFAANPPQSSGAGDSRAQLKSLSLEQLGEVEITTVSKQPEEVWQTPAAVSVVSQEDIRRSGATTIPELLRLVPGVEVARFQSGAWAVGVRGFNSGFSQDLLVLIDGRSVYTPLFEGVYWDVQDLIPLRLIDTAGLRTTASDEAEQHGIARTHEALADADLILLVHEATQPFTSQDRQLLDSIAGRPHLIVSNKIDLPQASSVLDPLSSIPCLRTSALTGEGLDSLRAAILSQLNAAGSLADSGLLNNLRQQQSVTDTLTAPHAAAEANAAGLPHELILLDLHAALRALDSLTSITTTDDILARIFSTFCIGK